MYHNLTGRGDVEKKPAKQWCWNCGHEQGSSACNEAHMADARRRAGSRE